MKGACEKHFIIPTTRNKKPVLGIHVQDWKDGKAVVFPHNATRKLRNLTGVDPDKVKLEALHYVAKNSKGVSPSLYQVDVKLDTNGFYFPEISLNLDAAEKLAERVRYCVWEAGGKPSGKPVGVAQVVASQRGFRVKPSFIRRYGKLANQRHACFVLSPYGALVAINARVDGDSERLTGFKYKLNRDTGNIEVERLFDVTNHQQVPETFYEASCAALDKAANENCEKPLFVKQASVVH